MAVEPTDPGLGLLRQPGDQIPRPAGRHNPVAVQVCRLVSAVVAPHVEVLLVVALVAQVREQCLVGDHQSDLHRGALGDLLPGEQLDQGVGHHLPSRAWVAGGAGRVGDPLQRRVAGHRLGRRQQCGQVRHRVRRRPGGDAPVVLRLADPSQHRAGIQPVGQPADLGHQPCVAPALHLCPAGTHQLGVHLDAMLRNQAGGLPRHQRSPPLREPALAQPGPGVRHLRDQHLAQSQVSGAAVRRLPPGQSNLPGHPLALQPGRHPCGGLHGTLRRIQIDTPPSSAAHAAFLSSSHARITSTRCASDISRGASANRARNACSCTSTSVAGSCVGVDADVFASARAASTPAASTPAASTPAASESAAPATRSPETPDSNMYSILGASSSPVKTLYDKCGDSSTRLPRPDAVLASRARGWCGAGAPGSPGEALRGAGGPSTRCATGP